MHEVKNVKIQKSPWKKGGGKHHFFCQPKLTNALVYFIRTNIPTSLEFVLLKPRERPLFFAFQDCQQFPNQSLCLAPSFLLHIFILILSVVCIQKPSPVLSYCLWNKLYLIKHIPCYLWNKLYSLKYSFLYLALKNNYNWAFYKIYIHRLISHHFPQVYYLLKAHSKFKIEYLSAKFSGRPTLSKVTSSLDAMR